MTFRSAHLFSILLLLIVFQATAQNIRSQPPTKVAVEGTPYMNDEYIKGTAIWKDQKYTFDFRYNIYLDQFEFKRLGKVESLTSDMPVLEVAMGENTFVIRHFQIKGTPVTGFFTVLDSGRISILRKMNVVMNPYVSAQPFQDEKPQSFARKADTYFLQIGTEPLTEIRNMKKLVQMLPDHQKEMEEFVKKEKLSAEKPEALKMFAQQYQSLQ